MTIDELFQDAPIRWLEDLPDFQRAPLLTLVETGKTFEEVAQVWLTASADNTFRLGAGSPVGDKGTFLNNMKAEVRAFICGDSKYEKERAGLFGEKGLTRTFVVSALAVAIAPHLAVAAPVVAPVIALVLASIGKITINAWCATATPGA